MIVLLKITIKSKRRVAKEVEIIKPKAARFIAVSSFSGSTIANSYLPVAIELKIVHIARNNAKTPKSSGEYRRVKIGLTEIGRAWAIVVPVSRVRTFLENSPFGKILFIPIPY